LIHQKNSKIYKKGIFHQLKNLATIPKPRVDKAKASYKIIVEIADRAAA
jgi:hypothetical protein